jgi:CMP-N-acetylneuraminic acid synthetase
VIFGKKILGIVAARSNSKRLKNKNILKYKKKMLIENAFESAKKSKFIDDIILS